MPSFPKLFTSLDGDYAPGTIVTLLSAAASLNPACRPLDAYVLDASPTEQPFRLVRETLEKFPSLLKLTRLKVDTCEYQHLPTLHNSHATYCRFQIPELVSCDTAIYMDSDFLCLKDLSSLPAIPEGCLAQAALNHNPSVCQQEFAHLSTELTNLTGSYYNAGFIRFSPKAWLQHEVKKSCLEAIERYRLRQHDQSALNFVLNGKISTLDQSWNFQRPFWSKLPLDLTPRNYHFDNIKPWHEYGLEGAFQLWYSFTQSTNGLQSIAASYPGKSSIKKERAKRFMAPYKAVILSILASNSAGHQAEKRQEGADHWREVAMITKRHQRNQQAIDAWRSRFKTLNN